jgi:hypothetical protein
MMWARCDRLCSSRRGAPGGGALDVPGKPEENADHLHRVQQRIERIRGGRSKRRNQTVALGTFLPEQFKRDHERAYKTLGQIAEQWLRLAPPELLPSTALASFQRGVLTVHVPDSTTAWSLERSLAEGFENSLRGSISSSALRRVKVVVNPESGPKT